MRPISTSASREQALCRILMRFSESATDGDDVVDQIRQHTAHAGISVTFDNYLVPLSRLAFAALLIRAFAKIQYSSCARCCEILPIRVEDVDSSIPTDAGERSYLSGLLNTRRVDECYDCEDTSARTCQTEGYSDSSGAPPPKSESGLSRI